MGVVVASVCQRLQQDIVLSNTLTALDVIFFSFYQKFVFCSSPHFIALESSKECHLLFLPLHLHVLSDFLDKFENPNIIKPNKTITKTLGHSEIAIQELVVAVCCISGGGLHCRMGVHFFPSTEN